MAAPMKISSTFLSKLYIRECILYSQSPLISHMVCCRKQSSQSVVSVHKDEKIINTAPKIYSKAQKISRAMRVYLEKARAYEKAVTVHGEEYEVGRRHLANMMGKDPDNFTHEDVKKAVRYLLPSGLHEPKARPYVPMPEDILPLHAVAQFGTDGRPFHFLFYTARPVYYEQVHEVTQRLERLKDLEAKMYREGKHSEIGSKKLLFLDSEFIDHTAMKKLLKGEVLSEEDFQSFLKMVSRLADHPLNYVEEEFIMKFRKHKMRISTLQKKEMEKLPDGRQLTTGSGWRKSSKATIKMIVPGTGEFTVNGKSILYFESLIHRESIMYPLDFTNNLMEVDIEAHVDGGGPTGQSGAIRNAISKALIDIVDEDMVEKMRQAGLLSVDPRKAERKKPFKRGARRGWTWKHR